MKLAEKLREIWLAKPKHWVELTKSVQSERKQIIPKGTIVELRQQTKKTTVLLSPDGEMAVVPSRPVVWREIESPVKANFEELHGALQDSVLFAAVQVGSRMVVAKDAVEKAQIAGALALLAIAGNADKGEPGASRLVSLARRIALQGGS